MCVSPCIRMTWLISMCAMTHPYMWHDYHQPILLLQPWKKERKKGKKKEREKERKKKRKKDYLQGCTAARRISPSCMITHSYLWCDSFIRMTWLSNMGVAHGGKARFAFIHDIYTCDMTHLYMWHDSSIWVWRAVVRLVSPSCMMYMCAMTHSYVCHDSSIWVVNSSMRVTWLISFIFTWFIHMCAMTAHEPPYHFFFEKSVLPWVSTGARRGETRQKSALWWLERRKERKKERFSIGMHSGEVCRVHKGDSHIYVCERDTLRHKCDMPCHIDVTSL